MKGFTAEAYKRIERKPFIFSKNVMELYFWQWSTAFKISFDGLSTGSEESNFQKNVGKNILA